MKSLTYFVFLSLFVSCLDNSNQKHPVSLIRQNASDSFSNDSFTEVSKHKSDIKFEYPDFETFYLKFISDSAFQISRVKFPLKGLYEDCDNDEKWAKDKWPYMMWDMRDKKNREENDSISVIQTGNKFFYGIYCIDCGFLFEMEFNKLNGQWFLTYRQENNC